MARKSKKNVEDAFRQAMDDFAGKLAKGGKPWALRRARRQFERIYVEYIIQRFDDDRQTAAERLDIGFSTLKEKIR